MKVLVACEFSGVVRDAFLNHGHDAYSCDIRSHLSCSTERHYQCDVLEILDMGWDLMIAHPPCTYLAISGNRWMKERPGRMKKRELALQFFTTLLHAPIPRICIENPIGVVSTTVHKHSQVVHPYYFGDPYRKATCLWLKGLPKLQPTNRVSPRIITHPNGARFSADYNKRRSGTRSGGRAITYPGIALAMVAQWGNIDSRWQRKLFD